MVKRSRRHVEEFTHNELRMLLSLLENDIAFSRVKADSLVDEWRDVYVHRLDNATRIHSKLQNMFRQTEPAARGK